MSDENHNRASDDAVVMSRKSWVAYLGLTAKAALGLAACAALGVYGPWEPAPWIAGGLAVLVAAIAVYHLLCIRSVRLYYDDAGVWAFDGVLPWRKGVHGVKWRDLDEVLYSQGFWPWLLRAHTIRISHRYTKADEIALSLMQRGDSVARQINARHVDLIESGEAR